MQIYKSDWISRSTTFQIKSTPKLLLETTKLALIDEEHKWNADHII